MKIILLKELKDPTFAKHWYFLYGSQESGY